jgi:hypothetical protein
MFKFKERISLMSNNAPGKYRTFSTAIISIAELSFVGCGRNININERTPVHVIIRLKDISGEIEELRN